MIAFGEAERQTLEMIPYTDQFERGHAILFCGPQPLRRRKLPLRLLRGTVVFFSAVLLPGTRSQCWLEKFEPPAHQQLPACFISDHDDAPRATACLDMRNTMLLS